MVYVSVLLFIKMDAASARKVMFSSYFYLMIVLLALFATDRIRCSRRYNNILIEITLLGKSDMSTVAMEQRKKIHPHKFTLWVGIGSLLMMFAGLTSAYIVKRNQANWKTFDLPAVLLVQHRCNISKQCNHLPGSKRHLNSGK